MEYRKTLRFSILLKNMFLEKNPKLKVKKYQQHGILCFKETAKIKANDR